MNKLCSCGRGIPILLAVGAILWGCASQRHAESPFADISEGDPLEAACEAALIKLHSLIVRRSTQTDFPESVLLEARELHKMGSALYLEREYTLALELLEEGIELVEEARD